MPVRQRKPSAGPSRGQSAGAGGRQSVIDKKREEEADKAKITELEKQLDAYNEQVFTLQVQIKQTRTQLKQVIDEARL